MPKRRVLNAAVIGIGNMGRNHARIYAELENVSLVAVADVNESAAKNLIYRHSIRIYSDYRQLLDREELDIVSVAVPTRYHCEVACEVIERGINVLIEKPLALTVHEGKQIIDSAERRDVKIMVGHIERFNPAVIEIKKRLDREELGKIFQLHSRRLSPFPERISDIGVVLDLATHEIDVMRYLLSSEVERVYAETEQRAHESEEDLLSGLMRFRNGVIGVLDVNWLTPTKVRQLSVLGEKGMYLVDYLTQDVYWYKNSDVADAWDALEVFRGVREGEMVKIHFQKKEPLRAELESFVTAVLEDREPQVNGRDGLVAIELAQKLLESGDKHAPIGLELGAE